VIRIPQFFNLRITAHISPPSWNGRVGGVLVINVISELDLAGFSLNASGRGFRGGGGRLLGGGSGTFDDFRSNASVNNNGSKGEGISGTPRFLLFNNSLLDNTSEGYPGGSHALGGPGNAGGGGTDGRPVDNSHNSGGGGGSNGGMGGRGGRSWNSALERGGHPGGVFLERSPSRLVMGGGGGSGTTNNGTGTPGSGLASSGAAGGGIVIVYARRIISFGNVLADGAEGNSTVGNDGSGGGGGGGSILIFAGNGHGNVRASARGGNGGTNSGGGDPHGPGGGGGGGVIYSNGPLEATSTVAGGINGITYDFNGPLSYGATVGQPGLLVTNYTASQIPNNMDGCQILPSSILEFSLQDIQPDVLLRWKVGQEMNVLHYVIEKSADGINFQDIGSVPATNQLIQHSYEFKDKTNLQQTFYRLKIVDKDGAITYSNVISLRVNQGINGSFTIFPNPTKGKVNISIPGSARRETLQILVTGINGQRLMQTQVKPGTSTVSLRLTIPYNGYAVVQLIDENGLVMARELLKIER
jgi:hypothetical protein